MQTARGDKMRANNKTNNKRAKRNATDNTYTNISDEYAVNDDIYTKEGLSNSFDEGLISSAEEGFMLGYLMA